MFARRDDTVASGDTSRSPTLFSSNEPSAQKSRRQSAANLPALAFRSQKNGPCGLKNAPMHTAILFCAVWRACLLFKRRRTLAAAPAAALALQRQTQPQPPPTMTSTRRSPSCSSTSLRATMARFRRRSCTRACVSRFRRARDELGPDRPVGALPQRRAAVRVARRRARTAAAAARSTRRSSRTRAARARRRCASTANSGRCLTCPSSRCSRRTSAPFETMVNGFASCTGAILLVDACRSVGVPARVVAVPEWVGDHDENGHPQGGGNHAWVEVWSDGGWSFTGAAEPEDRLNATWFHPGSTRGKRRAAATESTRRAGNRRARGTRRLGGVDAAGSTPRTAQRCLGRRGAAG